MALGHALVVAVFATAGFHISGAHMNPAVTLSLAVGGHITLIRAGFFVLAQVLGSSLACILLRALTGGLVRRRRSSYLSHACQPDNLKLLPQ